MPPKQGSKPITNEVIRELTNNAKTSPDAIFVETTLRTIAVASADASIRAQAVEEIARAHWNTTNVVVASLTSLVLLDGAATRRQCHAILSERFHPDRDVILARAATALIELSPPVSSDLPFISKALTSRIDLISADTRRALHNLIPSRALALLTVAREAAKEINTAQIVLALEERIANHGVNLPPRPTDVVRTISTEPGAPKVKRTLRPTRPPRLPQTESTQARERRAEGAPTLSSASTEGEVLLQETPHVTATTSQKPTSRATLAEFRIEQTPESADRSLEELKMIANNSKDHASILSSLTEILERHGPKEALECTSGLIWATSDPKNPLKAQFARFTEQLFPH